MCCLGQPPVSAILGNILYRYNKFIRFAEPIPVSIKMFQKRAFTCFATTKNPQQILHASMSFPSILKFETQRQHDSGPIPGDKNYDQETNSCQMSLTRRCNANHNNPDRTQRAERSWKRPAQQRQKAAKMQMHSMLNRLCFPLQLPITNDLCHRINDSYGFLWEVHENGSPIPFGFPGISLDPSEQRSMLLAAIYLHLSNMCRYTYIIHGASEHCFPF